MPSNSRSSADDALSQGEQAEAEAEADAQVAAARAGAQESPSRRGTGTAETETDPDTADDDELPDSAEEPYTDQPAPERAHRKRRLRVLGWRGATVAAATALLGALLATGGYFYWQSQQASQRHADQVAFSAAAGQAVANLLSLDFNKGDADVKRLIDSTTGEFRADFEKNKTDFMTVMKDAQVVTYASVRATAVESMAGDSAVVLIAATSKAASPDGAKQPTRYWRLSVTVERDNGEVKMSKVEFVP